MELQFEKRELSCLHQVLRGVKNQELTQEIRLTEDLPDVGRVLALWGQIILRGKEWQGSRIAVSGGIQTTLLYAPEDGSGPRAVDTWIPFQTKWDGAQTDREGPVRMGLLLRFVDGRNLSARKILVRAGISCLAEGLAEKRTEVYSAPEVPADVQLLRRSYPVRLPREAGEKTFTLEEKLETGSEPIGQIIAFTFDPRLTGAKVSVDKVAVRGAGKLHLVYSDRDGRIRTKDFEVPFSQLGELESAYEDDARADVMLAVTGLELDLEEENLALKCSLVAQYIISHRTVLELTEDAYSTRREVGLRQQELYLPAILDETRERIPAKVEFPDMESGIVDVRCWCGFPQMRREGERMEAEIQGRVQILGYDREGKLQGAAGSWTGSTGLNVDAASNVDAVNLPPEDLRWITGGDGMEVHGEVPLLTTTRSGRGLPMLTALELGECHEPNRDRPALILCRPGRRTLWDIAKGTGSAVGDIRTVNGIAEEPQDDRMLLIPIQ